MALNAQAQYKEVDMNNGCSALRYDPARVPEQMKAARRWMTWKIVERDGKPTKVPIRINGDYGSSTDPEAWSTHDEALAAYNSDGELAGLGFALGDGWVGIDVDEGAGDEGRLLVDRLKLLTYTERSPSGKGAHAIGFVESTFQYKGSKKDGVEQYSSGRYFTVTGHSLVDPPLTPGNIKDEMIAIHRRHHKPPPPRPHADIVSKVAAKDPELWAGDLTRFKGDHSSADLALVNLICFWTRDPDVIDAVFRESGLYREKWDRGDYRERTIGRALSDKKSFAMPVGERPRAAERDETTDKLILSTSRTLPTATSFMEQFYPDNSLVAHAGQLYRWTGHCYEIVEPDTLRNQIQPWLHNAVHWVKVGKTAELQPFPANPGTIDAALSSIRSLRSVLSTTLAPPAWIDGATGPDPRHLLFGRSYMLNMPSGEILENTPRMFNLTSIDADYDPDAGEPTRWLEFLRQLWPNDQESIDTLQQWFGYCLTADTSQQKALLIIGPKRGGKGTIARILRKVIGVRNYTGPTISALAGPFGLAPLIGKTLAVVGDARFHGENTRTVTDRLLSIIGEDPLTIDRKHLDSLELCLPIRFMFLTNEQPRFTDASGALPSRFIVLELHNSFYGRENIGLESELTAELPGILKWAVDGWLALQERGRFCNPSSTALLVEELDDLASPVHAFVKECCTTERKDKCYTHVLYHAWKAWCIEQGRQPGIKDIFVKNLRAAVPTLKNPKRKEKKRYYSGIDLCTDIGTIIPGYVPLHDIPTEDDDDSTLDD